MKRLMIGISVAVPLGVICGYAMNTFVWAQFLIRPFITLTYPLPKAALFPLLMVVFGIGDISRIILIAIGIFYYVCLSVSHSLAQFPRHYYDIGHIYRVKTWHMAWHGIGKGILPDFLQGCKVGISYGLVMVVVGEFIVARNGIGFFMWNAWDQFRITDVYACFVVFSLLGWSIFAVFDVLIDRLPWRRRRRNACA
jgi:NitT/TauT family transport system permease protein